MEKCISTFLGVSENVCFTINGEGKYIIIKNVLMDLKEDEEASLDINALANAEIEVVKEKVTDFERNIFKNVKSLLKMFNARVKSFTIDYNPVFDDEWVNIVFINEDGSISQFSTPRFKAREFFYGFERNVDYNIGEVLEVEW